MWPTWSSSGSEVRSAALQWAGETEARKGTLNSFEELCYLKVLFHQCRLAVHLEDEPTDELINGNVRIRNCAVLHNGYMLNLGLFDKSKDQEQSYSKGGSCYRGGPVQTHLYK